MRLGAGRPSTEDGEPAVGALREIDGVALYEMQAARKHAELDAVEADAFVGFERPVDDISLRRVE